MKNKEVCESFVQGQESKVKNLYSEHDNKGRLVLFSYGEHFPLAIKLNDCWLINLDGYSNTTSQHKGHLSRALNFNDFKDLEQNHDDDIILMDTNQLKNIKYTEIKCKADLTEEKI